MPYAAKIHLARADDSLTVGSDQYFVIGDNSANSVDSRSWGGVPEDNF